MWFSRSLSGFPHVLAAIACAGSLLASSCTMAPQSHNSKGGAPIRDARHSFRSHVQNWTELKKQNVILQQRDYSCGAAALATLVRYHLGDSATEAKLLQIIVEMLTPEEMKDRVKKGLSLTDLRRLAVKLGYQASIGRLEFDKLRESKVPLIVGIIVDDFNHFVVYRGTDGKYVYLADPARGNVRTPIAKFLKQWQKNAVLVVVKPGQTEPTKSPLSVRPEESFLGTLNDFYLRKQVTTKPIPQ